MLYGGLCVAWLCLQRPFLLTLLWALGKTPLPNVIAPSSLWFLPRNREESSEDACEN